MTVSDRARSASEIAGVPMLPPTSAANPAAVMISPTSVVVVVLPFDPVMATIGPVRNRAASSISPMTVSPRVRACTSGGASTGTPGLTTIRSCPRKVRSPCPPVSTVMPLSSRTGISLRSSSPLLVSETETLAPCRFRNNADATPDFPRPTTSTRFPFSSMEAISPRRPRRHGGLLFRYCAPWPRTRRQYRLPQFQRRQREQSEDERGDPEPYDDLRF